MSTHAVSTRQLKAEVSPRSIVLRTRGHVHGAVTRLVSPNDIGQMIKPFVFLDYFEADPANAPKFGFHPHSGIATLTLILSGQAFYKETTEREGVIKTGGVEWMRASGPRACRARKSVSRRHGVSVRGARARHCR
jgi:redox-sensitive bicupin YhaK (pirin superfamily)